MLDHIWLYTDGAARGNPGPAAAGFRILGPGGELLFEHEEPLGERTNNQAEYAALILGLEACREYTSGTVWVGSESQLLIQQMKGVWRVKDSGLQVLHTSARAKVDRFRGVKYEHYPRTHAEIAKVDRALNRLLDLESQGHRPSAAV